MGNAGNSWHLLGFTENTCLFVIYIKRVLLRARACFPFSTLPGIFYRFKSHSSGLINNELSGINTQKNIFQSVLGKNWFTEMIASQFVPVSCRNAIYELLALVQIYTIFCRCVYVNIKCKGRTILVSCWKEM